MRHHACLFPPDQCCLASTHPPPLPVPHLPELACSLLRMFFPKRPCVWQYPLEPLQGELLIEVGSVRECVTTDSIVGTGKFAINGNSDTPSDYVLLWVFDDEL